jgi:3-hydroxyacyl-CoA dehydrogenase/enoyl-CoA hydratase/3-hydroxybutyryl-CoA epimerase
MKTTTLHSRSVSATDTSTSPPITLEVGADEIALLRFDRPGSSANIFDSSTLRLLDELLAGLEDARGVILVSAKPAIFIAGADLRELAAAENREELVAFGQETFSKLAALPGVTVAAIHGACAGGGLEISLACDWRVASPDSATRIGLPEVNLGVIPAWGGSTRLPRLVGLPRALEIILGGELLLAEKARRLGVVDALGPRERLVGLARQFILRGKPRRSIHRAWAVAAPVVAAQARKRVLEKTRGHYPAPLAAIDVVAKSLARGIPRSLEAEREAIARLAEGDVCRNLIRVFFLQDRARRRKTPQSRPVRKAAVIGAGVMGSGIAQWLAARGVDVLLRDVGADQLAAGLKRAAALCADAERRGLMSAIDARAAMDRLVPAEVSVPMKSADLVIEAAVERLDLKQRLFAELEGRVRDDAVLATNTSALPLVEIARGLRCPERVVGLHFFNPVHRMKLVEVVRPEAASPEAIDTAVAFALRIGKLPVVVRDRPGFLGNRILLPYLLEAAHLFEGGASVEAIDGSMLDFGMPMGPLRLLDEIGLDVGEDVARTLCAAFPDRMRLPLFFERMLGAGWKGRKSGRGFYEYRNGRAAGANAEMRKFQQSDIRAELTRAELQQRMELLMINEAARCLEEGVVETAEDVDFAMVMGTGFAPFRGGPLRHADVLGIEKVAGALHMLADAGEPQFAPSARLLEMSASHGRFYDDD